MRAESAPIVSCTSLGACDFLMCRLPSDTASLFQKVCVELVLVWYTFLRFRLVDVPFNTASLFPKVCGEPVCLSRIVLSLVFVTSLLLTACLHKDLVTRLQCRTVHESNFNLGAQEFFLPFVCARAPIRASVCVRACFCANGMQLMKLCLCSA